MLERGRRSGRDGRRNRTAQDTLGASLTGMRVKVGSVAFLKAVGSGFGVGLDDDGHLIEFLGDWRALAELQPALGEPEPVYVNLEDWQIVAVDDEVRLPLRREAMAERAVFVRSALAAMSADA
jgi:hypothetical protein